MGDVYVEIEVENYADRILADHGYIPTSNVRREKIQVLTDTAATMLALPQDLVDTLGLRKMGTVIVTYANEKKEERDVAGALTVHVGERRMNTDCVVDPPGSEPLLGQVVLESLDLLVDCKEGKLVPRPESPYLPLLKLK